MSRVPLDDVPAPKPLLRESQTPTVPGRVLKATNESAEQGLSSRAKIAEKSQFPGMADPGLLPRDNGQRAVLSPKMARIIEVGV
jgi:hypothetical protein